MRKGDLLFWGINDFLTTKEEIEKLGFGEFVPRNDFRTAMIKTLHEITKGNKKMYRRFNDTKKSVSFGLFLEKTNGNKIALDNEVVIIVDKIHGNLDFHSEVVWDASKVREIYAKHKDTIDSDQLRTIVLDIVRKGHGVAMRQGGGIYYVDARFADERKAELAKIFGHFSAHAKLNIVPVYDDKDTLDSLEGAVSDDIFGSIEKLVKDIEKRFNEGTITRRQLEGDKERCMKIAEKIKVHEINLRSKASDVSKRLEQVMNAVNKVTSVVEDGLTGSETFMDMLKGV